MFTPSKDLTGYRKTLCAILGVDQTQRGREPKSMPIPDRVRTMLSLYTRQELSDAITEILELSY